MTGSSCDARGRRPSRAGEGRPRRSADGRRAAAGAARGAIGLPRGIHAAEALLIARIGKVAKTHAGVHAEFARLTRDLPASDGELRRILGRGYAFKELADYGTDPTRVVTDDDASALIADAARFVDRVAELLAPPPDAG